MDEFNLNQFKYARQVKGGPEIDLEARQKILEERTCLVTDDGLILLINEADQFLTAGG